MFAVNILEQAECDIDEICAYVSQWSANAAGHFLDDIGAGLKKISENPRIYPRYPQHRDYRSMLVHNYLVFYKIDDEDNTVNVYRVLHGKRDIANILETS
jgi:plasmid stabilization system protein ParE